MDKNNMLSNMFGNKLMDRYFRKVEDCVWDLMTGKIGVVVDDGIATIDQDAEGNYSISLNIFTEMSCPIPAFAQNTKIEDVKVGDLIYTSKKNLGWVIEKKDHGKLRLLNKDGNESTWTPPKVSSILGMDSGCLVLRSLINTLPGGETGLDGFKNNLLPLMMMGGDSEMIEKMIPMMLMGGMNGNAGNMMQTMMLMNMMGKGGSTGFGGKNFFDRSR